MKRHSHRDAPTCRSHLTAFLHETAVPSLIPRTLPDFITQPWRKIDFLYSCEIKSASGLKRGQTVPTYMYVPLAPAYMYIADELAVACLWQWVGLHNI